MHRARELAPGLALVAGATVVAYLVNAAVPLLSALLVAIMLGVLLRNLGLIRPGSEPGVTFAAKKILRVGVVLLGFQLSVPVIVGLGWGPILVILATVTLTFLGTLAAGRALHLPRAHRLLVATGTSICGASAVAAMAAVVQRPGALPDQEDDASDAAATAVAAVTLFGTVSLIALPLLIGALGMGQQAGGVWIGAGVHEVGQVVAAGGLVGPEALQAAVLTKLGRVLTLAPIVVLVGVVLARAAERAARQSHAATASDTAPSAGGAGSGAARPPLLPLFVAGFVAMVVLRSLLGLPDAHPLPATVKLIASLTLTAAMVGLGAGVKVRTLLRTGGPILLLSAIASVIAATVSLVGVLLLV